MAEVDPQTYIDRAEQRIVEELEEHHSLVHPELEARLGEGYFKKDSRNIDPHHVTTALRNLYGAGKIVSSVESTRGGSQIETISLASPGRTLTAIQVAARRKRLLLGRYRGWSQGTRRHPQGLTGPAGEAATRQGLLASGKVAPVVADAGHVSSLLGVQLPGPADSAVYYIPTIGGIPQATITLLIEVKNLRSWIYPSSIELYQPLNKARIVQQAQPRQHLVPFLVCRRAHSTTFWMAKQLGFVVIELDTQYAGDVDQDVLDEVRNELHFKDLRVGTGPSLRVRDRLRSENLMAKMPDIAATWADTSADSTMSRLIQQLVRETRNGRRAQLLESLRQHNTIHLGNRGGW